MKRKFYSLIMAVFLMLCFSTLVSARGAAVGTVDEASPIEVAPVEDSPASWQETIKQRIEARKEESQEKKTEVKAKLTERVRNRVSHIYQRVRTRLQKRIERLEKIADRVESRFSFFEEKGRDTIEAQAKLAEAEQAIETAKADLSSLDQKSEELLNSEDPKAAFAELKEMVHTVKKDISTARQALSTTVNALVRNNQGGEDVE